MGLFSKKNKKEKEEATVAARDVYTYTVHQVFDVKGGCVVVGFVYDADMYVGDTVYVLSREGKMLKTEIETMENPKVGKMVKGEPGSNVALLLKGLEVADVKPGDVISNLAACKDAEDKKRIANPRLKGLLSEMKKTQAKALLNLVLEEIATEAQLLTIAKVEKNEKGDTIMQFPMLKTSEVKPYYPAFTDWSEIEKWQARPDDGELVVFDFDGYMDLLNKNKDAGGMVINPFSINYGINRQGMEQLKTQKAMIAGSTSDKTDETDKKDANQVEIQVGDPQNIPEEMLAAASACMKDMPGVKQAWLRAMLKSGELSYLVVIDFEGEAKEVFEKVGKAMKPHIKEGRVNMVACEEGFGKKAVQGVEPFYTK